MTNSILKEIKKIKRQIAFLDKKISKLPEGNLLITHNGKYAKWFLSNPVSAIYIPKKDREYAESLAAKKYYLLKKKELEQLLALYNYDTDSLLNTQQSSNKLLTDPGYAELISSHLKKENKKGNDWANADYPKNNMHPESLIHKTLSGHKVRSKSEVLIANALFSHNIPFRYEYELILNSISFSPDFTIMHPLTEKIIYWEHFGMMDNTTYCTSAFNKLLVFSQNDIIPSINLITTYETSYHPLNSTEIEDVISKWFLE